MPVENNALRGAPLVLLRVEGASVFAASSYAFALTGLPWSFYAAPFFAPDLGMLGYLGGPRIGAVTYNALHFYALPLLLGVLGLLAGQPLFQAIAAIWAAHIGFDRMFGYGLKYASAFTDTHLDRIGVRART